MFGLSSPYSEYWPPQKALSALLQRDSIAIMGGYDMVFSVRQAARSTIACAAVILALLLCWWAGTIASTEAAAQPTLPTLAEIEAQRAFLEGYGWEVGQQPTCDYVSLPAAFTSEYDEYLALQARCGFTLTDYAGETVLRCTYEVLNYPGAAQYVYADLLTCDGEIIGGDIRSSALDGFMHSLYYPT